MNHCHDPYDCRRLRRARRAFSLISLVITVGCIALLLAIMLPALQGVTGKSPGKTRSAVSRFQDGHNLNQIYQVLLFEDVTGDGARFPVPSERFPGRGDVSLNTTAHVFERLMASGIPPQMFVSRTEQNPAVEVYSGGEFKADLTSTSHTSYAHVPLYGERFRHWKHPDNFPLLGHRGPKDGIEDANSYACDEYDGSWSGQILFGDGHFENLTSMMVYRGDNLFVMEEGIDGGDAYLAFTVAMSEAGPTVQHD